jgi:Fe-S-cluster-containing dehydrogenase component/CRP-like cAMP-binding protein
VSEHIASRPERWDKPFGSRKMSDELIDRVLAHPTFAEVDPKVFSDSQSLREIIANDARYRHFSRGDILFRRGDYGSSLFILVSGSVRGVDSDAAEEMITPRESLRKKSWFGSTAQLWRNTVVPEYRKAVRYAADDTNGDDKRGAQSEATHVDAPDYTGPNRRRNFGNLDNADKVQVAGYQGPDRRSGAADILVSRLDDIDVVIDGFPTFPLEAPAMFGEIAALSRSPRTATLFADGEVEAVELRWQGLRDIRKWSDSFHQTIDELYRERGLLAHLRAAPIFSGLDAETLRKIADETLFETYGGFEWTQQFQRERSRADGSTEGMIDHEPVIAQEGHYIDGVLLIRWGFARLSETVDRGERTVGYLSTNDVFGLEEIKAAYHGDGDRRLTRSLRAIGYVDVLRVPTRLIEEYVLPTLDDAAVEPSAAEAFSGHEPLIDFLVDNRIVNGTATMLIDTNRCVNCDDCVRACASTHDGNPRFVRHGTAHLNLMVANACMHCVDPVCLIGCPTAAIHRSPDPATRSVIIDDSTCIGCGTCAASCPYNNIRMVETRDSDGAFIVDSENAPIIKATKCDLCAGQLGGPACVRACPHDALIRADIHDTVSLIDWIEQ